MVNVITRSIRKFLNKFGYEVIRLEDNLSTVHTGKWLLNLQIQTIIDVGSNEGQFLQSIEHILPGKKIIAFEPIKSVYDKLLINTNGMDIIAFNCALSDAEGTSEINISQNLVSSSILKMEKLHNTLYPESTYIKKETIQLKRLDDIIKIKECPQNILLKIDVQGYENKVIAGGHNVISTAAVIIIEFSYQPVYEGQWLFDETYKYFNDAGFKFIGFADQVLTKKTQIPLYGDAIFVRRDFIDKLQYAI